MQAFLLMTATAAAAAEAIMHAQRVSTGWKAELPTWCGCCVQLGDADASDVCERLEDFLSICAPPDSNDEFKVRHLSHVAGWEG